MTDQKCLPQRDLATRVDRLEWRMQHAERIQEKQTETLSELRSTIQGNQSEVMAALRHLQETSAEERGAERQRLKSAQNMRDRVKLLSVVIAFVTFLMGIGWWKTASAEGVFDMPAKVSGGSDVRQQFRRVVQTIKDDKAVSAVHRILALGAQYSAMNTPVATSTLIDSQYRDINITMDGVKGVLGYGVHYAEAVHEAPGVLWGEYVLRSPASLGYVWGPDGEPEFLRLGIERDAAPMISAILRQEHKL